MNTNYDKLKNLIQRIRQISFLGRLFGWGSIKEQIIDAASDLQKMESNMEHLEAASSEHKAKALELSKDLEISKTLGITKIEELKTIEAKLPALETRITSLTAELASKA